jgi:two-component system response regulator RegA
MVGGDRLSRRVPEATPAPRARLLIVEDEAALRSVITRAATRLELDVMSAGDYETAIGIAERYALDYVLLDVHLPGGSGFDLLPFIRERNPEARIVLCTAYASIAAAVGAVRGGACDYLCKPATTDQMLAALGLSLGPQADPMDGVSPLTLARARWEHIHRVLRECGGNISTAARSLGIQRQSLQRMLKKNPPP